MLLQRLKYNYPEIGCWNRNWDEMAVRLNALGARLLGFWGFPIAIPKVPEEFMNLLNLILFGWKAS
jgi:hypothetical protein